MNAMDLKTMSEKLNLQEKLGILADAAKYDVACTLPEWIGKTDRKGLVTLWPQESATALQGTAAVSLC